MITLYTYNYDNNYKYIKTFSDRQSQINYFNDITKLVVDDTEYIKEQEDITIEYSLDYLEEIGVNYLSFNNNNRTTYAFITDKEYVRHNLTKIKFEVDVIQSFLFDFTISNAFIKRKVCELSEITDYDEGIEFGEHVLVNTVNSLEKQDEYFAMFTGFREYYIQETDGKYDYIEAPTSIDKPVTYVDGVPYPLLFYPLAVEGNDTIFSTKLQSLPNLVGIIRFTNVTYSTTPLEVQFLTINENRLMKTSTVGLFATNIQGTVRQGAAMSVSKSTIFDFYPYTYYVVDDEEVEPLILQPQYCSNSISVTGYTAPSTTPIERYSINSYKNSSDGKIYYIENSSVSMLPVGTNAGIETLSNNYYSYNASNVNTGLNTVLKGVGAITSFATKDIVGGITQVTSGISDVMTQIARNNDIKLTPNTVKSLGTPNTRQKFNTKHVKILKYSIQDKYKNRIQSFINKYGNKYNQFGSVNIKSYKGYIEMIDVDIDSNIDNDNINKIIQVLEGGVFIE